MPGGDPCRNSPKVILTAPDANCAKAVLTGSEKVPLPGDATSAARLAGSAARIGASGKAITPSALAAGGGAGGSGGFYSGGSGGSGLLHVRAWY